MKGRVDERDSSAAPSLKPPVSLGRHQLLFPIGHGGMSDVYLALVTSAAGVNKLLVVKQLRASLLDEPEALAMFMDEARLAARLHHPNVVQTFEVGQQGPLPYMTMEFLDGQPLHRVLRRLPATPQPLTLAMHLRIVIEMLEGLHYAHELLDYDGTPLDVVHRDVSPQNLFVTYYGQIKLVDFGIAKAGASISHTDGRGLKGKLAYMSPEQAGGEIVDRRTDVFAAGVMLWEMLAGRRFWADVDENSVLRRLVQHELPDLAIEGAPAPLLEICRRAIAPQLERRYATAEAFRLELERYMAESGLDASIRTIGKRIASAFADERAQVRSRIDHELLRQGAGGSLSESPISLWRDSYRDEHTDRTMASSEEHSLAPDEITADLGPRPAASSEAVIGPEEGPSKTRRRVWPTVATLTIPAALAFALSREWSSGSSELTDTSAVEPSPPSTPAVSRCELPLSAKPRVPLTGEIDQNATLHCDRAYVLTFTTRVTAGATLTIEAGTTILGDRATKGTLIVEPGARLIADGTRERPIVFTSARPEHQRRPGDWGGLLLLGDAPINLRDAEGKPMLGQVEGLTEVSSYGGSDPDDDSGVLRYVRIEYPGVEVAPANEINGLTLAGVGRGTVIDHVAVKASSDDCFEFFGGTVDAKYLVCDSPGDDALDFDYGYRGRIQYVVVRDWVLDDPSSSTPSNAFELDNEPNGSNAEPRTRPVIWNATLRGVPGGESASYAILARRAATAEFHGLSVSGFDFAIDLRDPNTEIELTGIALVDQPTAEVDERDDDTGFDEHAWLTNVMAEQNFAGPPNDGFFQPWATWIGAFEGPDDDWTAGWSA
jgi:serine/threonine protein kinase